MHTLAQPTTAPRPHAGVALREVRLYGHLGDAFGRVHRLAVATAAEAVQALCVVVPGFEHAFLGPDGRARYHVYVGQGRQREPITLGQTIDPVGAAEAIRVVPVLAGAKSGFATALLGAALMVVAGPLAGSLGTSAFVSGLSGIVYSGTLMVGQALVVGGVIQLLSPQRHAGASTTAENVPSYAFDGPVNTTNEGVCVPVAYGRVFVGGAVISSGLATSDQADAAAPAPAPAPTQDLPAEQPLDPREQP